MRRERLMKDGLAAVIVTLSVFSLVAVDFGISAASQTARVQFVLRGLAMHTQPLRASANPQKTGLGKPPIVVTITGGQPPYTAACQNSLGYDIRPSGESAFTATRVVNGVGTSQMTIKDSVGATIQVPLHSMLTGLPVQQPKAGQQPPAPPAPPTTRGSGQQASVHFVLRGLRAPLSAAANPQVTGLGKPPAVVTVAGGRPPYTITQNNPGGYSVQPSGNNAFTVTRTHNASGIAHFTITDQAGARVDVPIKSVLIVNNR